MTTADRFQELWFLTRNRGGYTLYHNNSWAIIKVEGIEIARASDVNACVCLALLNICEKIKRDSLNMELIIHIKRLEDIFEKEEAS